MDFMPRWPMATFATREPQLLFLKSLFAPKYRVWFEFFVNLSRMEVYPWVQGQRQTKFMHRSAISRKGNVKFAKGSFFTLLILPFPLSLVPFRYSCPRNLFFQCSIYWPVQDL